MNGLESSLISVRTRLKSLTKWSRKRLSMSVSMPSMRTGNPRAKIAKECLLAAVVAVGGVSEC